MVTVDRSGAGDHQPPLAQRFAPDRLNRRGKIGGPAENDGASWDGATKTAPQSDPPDSEREGKPTPRGERPASESDAKKGRESASQAPDGPFATPS